MTHTSKVVISVLAVLLALAVVGLGVVASQGSDTETVSVTPQSCIDALDTSEELVAGPVIRMTDRSLELLDMVSRAFEAGLYGDSAGAQSIITDLNTMTEDIKADNEVISELADDYQKQSQDCRNSAGKNS